MLQASAVRIANDKPLRQRTNASDDLHQYRPQPLEEAVGEQSRGALSCAVRAFTSSSSTNKGRFFRPWF